MTEPPLSAVPAEARAFQGRNAGLVTRSIAAIVDAAVVGVVLVAMYLGLNGLLFLIDPRAFTFRATNLLFSLAMAWGVTVVYLTVCWAVTGRSYGCHVMGLSVVDRRGRRPRLWTALVRAAICAFVPIGLLWCGWSRSNRSLQDLLLGTRVVYDWIPHPPAVAVPAPRSSSEDEAAAVPRDHAGGTF
ncbi:RDD family protein [Nocardioides sp. P5_C9_2]